MTCQALGATKNTAHAKSTDNPATMSTRAAHPSGPDRLTGKLMAGAACIQNTCGASAAGAATLSGVFKPAA